jgi:hypothetical protein
VESALALLFGGAWLALQRRMRNARDLQRQREHARRQAAAERLKQMAAASLAGNATLFFDSARGALQQVLSLDWQIEPDQITTGEVDARLGPEEEGIRELFALADEASYSGDAPQAADFARWTSVVNRRVAPGAAA